MKYKIYLGIIAALSVFLIYAIFFMKSDYVTKKDLPSNVAITKVTPGDFNISEYKPDFLPKPIPADVLKGAEENDFYYYLFINPNKKTVFYQYKPASSQAADSEDFHKGIDNYLKKVLIDGRYKNYYVTDKGAAIYDKRFTRYNKVMNYTPGENDSKKDIEKMAERKARIEAVKDFYKECSKTFCIINNNTKEYVVIDKRDLAAAKKALKDYKNW